MHFPGGSDGKESTCNAGDAGLIPGLGGSPGEENGHPLQYPCLENPHGWRSLVGYSLQDHKESDMIEQLLEASVRHSARGKGHEEGGSTYAKAGSSLRSPPGNPRASTPITRACLLYYFVLTYTSDFTGGCPPPPLLEKELT